MKTLLSIFVAIGVATADVSHLGYSYDAPSATYGGPAPTYGVPFYNTGSSGNKVTYTFNKGGSPSGFSFVGGAADSTSSAGSGSHYTTTDQYNYNQLYNQPATGQSSFIYNQHSQEPSQTFDSSNQGSFNYNQYNANQFSSYNQYQAEAVQKYQKYYTQIHQQPAQVFKHYYVHEAPADFVEPVRPRQPLVLPQPQKHYKVIFIKAPIAAPVAPQLIPVPQQNEEKTIVYVLSKKNEAQHDVVVPKIAPRPPSKPEVYFIKYNDKHGSQAVINNIVNEYNRGGSDSSHVDYSGVSNLGGTSNDGSYVSSQQSGGSFVQQGQAGATLDTSYLYPQAVSGATSASSTSSGSSITVDLDKQVTGQGVPHETYGTPNFRS